MPRWSEIAGRLRGLGGLRALVSRRRPDAELLEELESTLLLGDVGVTATERILEAVRRSPDEPANALRRELLQALGGGAPLVRAAAGPTVTLAVGVNGTGKTTTLGKLAHRYRAEGRQVILVAADTFRAAAAEQLEVWARRTGAGFVGGSPGQDPAAVAYDGVEAALRRGLDDALVDTAGRLATEHNLMAELRKIHRSVGRAVSGAPHEVLLILDAGFGQNAVAQARRFTEAVAVTGLVLTKLDGISRGGAVVGIASELNLPVKLVGTGEGVSDLEPFDPEAYVDALLDTPDTAR